MRPRDHVIAGTIGAAALYPALGLDAVFFWAASIAIDLDHYLDYIYHNRFTDFSFKRMFRYHGILSKKWASPEFINLEIFHTVEFLVPLFIFSRWTGSPALFAVCLGFLFHVFLDAYFLFRKKVPFIRAHSFTEYYIRRRMLEKKGLSPVGLYLDAAKAVRKG